MPDEEIIAVGDSRYAIERRGSGPPVLLLHGFPQTRRCWRAVAPALEADHEVIAADLKGYGASTAPPGGPQGEGYTKREMAAELAELMSSLGHERFAVVGHDRGARVAFRLALDHPDRIERAAVLNIVPTVDQFDHMGDGPSLGYWPWFLLAQPAPFPEELLRAAPQAVLDQAFDTWTARPEAIDAESRAAYLAAMDESTIAAMCGDYRASFHIDRLQESEDRAAGRRITVPLLAITGDEETQLADAPEVWARWADDLTTATVPGGHFVPEEGAQELVALLHASLG